jgi:NTE family protein
MAGTALVLSGGGAKGAFQVGAEAYAREVGGFKWDIIAGVSVGALNASMLAMEKYDELRAIWDTASNDKIYTGKMPSNLWDAMVTAVKILLNHKSLLGNDPLRRLIEHHYDAELLRGKDVRVGAVSLRTGAFEMFDPGRPGFKEAVLASTAMPVYWPPEQVSPEFPDMVDGGLRNISPLGDVIDNDPDQIVIINCSRREPSEVDAKRVDNLVKIAARSLDIALNEIFVTDLQEFLRINDMVAQLPPGVTLYKDKAKTRAFKNFKSYLIEPQTSLGDTLDFSQASVQMRLEAGRRAAEIVLGPAIA